MSELATAVGLVFIIEGVLYAVAPDRLKAMLAMMERIPNETLRMGGLFAVGVGVAIVWLARRVLAG